MAVQASRSYPRQRLNLSQIDSASSRSYAVNCQLIAVQTSSRQLCLRSTARLKPAKLTRMKAGFFDRFEPRLEDWGLRMLCSAQVLRNAGYVDWKSCAGPAKTVLGSRALEIIPMMEYVWEMANRVLVD